MEILDIGEVIIERGEVPEAYRLSGVRVMAGRPFAWREFVPTWGFRWNFFYRPILFSIGQGIINIIILNFTAVEILATFTHTHAYLCSAYASPKNTIPPPLVTARSP